MRTEGINRIVVAVHNVEKASDRYSELLGISFWDAGVQEEFGLRALVSWDGGVELVSPLHPQSDVAKFLERRGEGIYAVAFNVRSVEEARAMAKEKGIRVTQELGWNDADRFKVVKEIVLHPADAHGVPIILFEGQPK